jgi:hypothetical protein
MAQIDKGSIVVGYVHNHIVDEAWARSLALAFREEENQLIGVSSSRGPRHEEARNNTIRAFLDGPGEWFLWIDTDQTFAPEAPAELRRIALERDARMCTGITYVWNPVENKLITNGWKWNEDELAWQDMHIRVQGSSMNIDGTGSACVLIHRDVLEEYGEEYGPEWHKSWTTHPVTGKYMGHDLAFFYRTVVRGSDKLVWATGVEFGHIKKFELDWAMYQRATSHLWKD